MTVAGCINCTENVPTMTDIGGVVVDIAYSSNVQDIALRLQAPANINGNSQGLQ